MFYSQFILAKNGPLGTIWIAAHLERKLRKNQVADTDIGLSVDSILSPDVPIALRLSSHLLLGVVRIYNRKVNYLFDDCSEAVLKVKQAFRSTAVDLPPEQSKAPYHSITLPETFDLDDFELPENDMFQGNYVDHHVSSREQITLQDTMDGMALSTSRFGLDERFGDADTSGVDLDEELFLDKDGTSGNVDVSVDPQSSVHIMAPVKHDIMTPDLEPMINGADKDVDLMDEAQAPRTPGLLEEPNLSNAQETSACEDHFETAERHLTEAIKKDSLGKIFDEKIDQNKHVDDWSMPDINSDTIVPMATENGHHSSDLDVNKPQEVAVEQKSLDTHASASELSSRVEDHASSVSELAELDSNVSNMDEQYQVLVPCKANQGSIIEGNQSLDPKSFSENVSPSSVHISGVGDALHDFDMSSEAQDNAVHEVGNTSVDPALDGLCHAADGISFTVDNLTSIENVVENVHSSGSPDVLGPEKLRSVTDGADSDPVSLVMDYTPVDLVRNDDGDAGSIFISGKKRTYTESTLTDQSLYTVESSGIAQSKRTAESIPDDEDLLSSILAGRKTSVLKIKPTPSPRVITSVKRRRSITQAGTTKRKVLIDDSMVLHGDTIRRQLMNTEDIRRVRKKAPCTRPEISMIQKQFLEEEMFIEPICTGLSIDLASLHNQTHDLGGIVVSVDDGDCASLELHTTENCDNLNTEAIESSKDWGNEGLVGGENSARETIDAPSVALDAQDGNCISSLHDNVIESKLKAITEGEENRSLPEDITNTELYGRRGSVADVVNTTAVDSSLPSDLVSGDHVDISADLAQVAPSDDKSAGEAQTPDINIIFGDSALHHDAKYMPRDQTADEVSLEMASPCKIGVAGKDLGKDFDNVTAVEVVPLTSDEQLLETAEGTAILETEAWIKGGDMEYSVNTMVDKDIEQMGSYPKDMDLHMEDVLLDSGKLPFQQDGDYPLNIPDMDSLVCDYADISSIADNETEFLNVDDDDDELVEATDDHMPNKDASVTDNSGWSSRTRAVANYLQGLFVKQGGNTRQTLTMDNLLIGKTRKEASRMFFEALVLKTKDYLDVEQVHPLENISLRPRMKLVKSDFKILGTVAEGVQE